MIVLQTICIAKTYVNFESRIKRREDRFYSSSELNNENQIITNQPILDEIIDPTSESMSTLNPQQSINLALGEESMTNLLENDYNSRFVMLKKSILTRTRTC